MAADNQSEISFGSVQERWHGDQILLVFVQNRDGIAGRRRLVAQPGGLTSGFALHLVSFQDASRFFAATFSADA